MHARQSICTVTSLLQVEAHLGNGWVGGLACRVHFSPQCYVFQVALSQLHLQGRLTLPAPTQIHAHSQQGPELQREF